jgi:tetratricopeptide (TPR) repeat protein
MKRTMILSIAAAGMLAAFAALQAKNAWAEQIPQNELSAPSTSTTTPTTAPEVKEAAERFKQRDFEGARKLLATAAKKDSDMPPADIILAQWFSQVNAPTGVRSALERAVIDDPNDPEAYFIMADVALRDRRVTEAKLLLDKANSLLATWKGSEKRKTFLQPKILAGLATVEEARDNWTGAEAQINAWLAVEPKSTMALQQLAQCLLHEKKVDEALAKLQEAKKLDNEILTPEASLARYYAQAGDQKNARKWMIEALTKAPTDLKTRLSAAQWAWETGKLDEARKQAASALEIDPKSVQAMILCGVISLFQKDYNAAETYFEQAHLKSPKEFAASNNLALALAEQKDPAKRERALEYAESNVRQYSKSAEAYSTYGWVLYRLGRLEEAQNALAQAISGGQYTAETAYYLARVLADRGGNDAKAKQFLEEALKTTAPFAQRDDAQELLTKLKK